jgi:hypothetical protein
MKHLLLNSFLIVSGILAAQPMPIDDAALLAMASETTTEVVDEKTSPARLESHLEQGRMDAEFVVIVEADMATPMLVQLLDAQGKALPFVKMVNLEAGSNSIQIDLSNYPTGSYMVSLQATQQRSSVLHKLYKR